MTPNTLFWRPTLKRPSVVAAPMPFPYPHALGGDETGSCVTGFDDAQPQQMVRPGVRLLPSKTPQNKKGLALLFFFSLSFKRLFVNEVFGGRAPAIDPFLLPFAAKQGETDRCRYE